MEIRILKYFLAIAMEGSISKAANVLHITQPTLSRQLKAFEVELGTPLFDRDNNMALTSAGMLLKDRAQEIIQLVDQTEEEFEKERSQLFNGHISFGVIEGTGSAIFSQLVATFQEKYPEVTYTIFTGTGDDILSRIDKGLIDIGIVLEPINLDKYNTVSLNNPESWGALMHRNHPLTELNALTPEDLLDEPLFISGRGPVIQRHMDWFNKNLDELNIRGHYNLLSNMALLVERKVGIALATEDAGFNYQNENISFIPLQNAEKSDSVLSWKRDRILSPTVEGFIEHSTQILNEN